MAGKDVAYLSVGSHGSTRPGSGTSAAKTTRTRVCGYASHGAAVVRIEKPGILIGDGGQTGASECPMRQRLYVLDVIISQVEVNPIAPLSSIWHPVQLLEVL